MTADIDGLRQWNGRLGDPLTPAHFSQFIQQLGGDPRTILAEAHLSYALPLVQQAIKGKSPAKLEIARWRHILECEPPKEEDTCQSQLAHLRDGMVGRYLSLLGQTPSIFAAHPIFKTWVFRAVSDNDVSTEVAYTPISSYTPELAIELWVTDRFRAALERRLESCAYVFLRTERATTAHLCLAAAHSIRVASPALTSNPFLIAMAHQSIRQG